MSCPFRRATGRRLALLLLIVGHGAGGGELFVNPLRVEIVAPAGAAHEDSIVLRNDGSAPVRVAVDVFDETPCGTSSWIRADTGSSVVNPNQERSVGYRIAVPHEAAGELRARIGFVEEAEEGSDAPLQVVTRLAVPIYVTIRGTESHDAKVEDIRVVSTNPWRAEVVVRNRGNIHIRPRGELRVMDERGRRLLATIPVNEWGYPVLPGQSAPLLTGATDWGPAPETCMIEAALQFDGGEIHHRQLIIQSLETHRAIAPHVVRPNLD